MTNAHTIDVWADTKGPDRCRGKTCGAPIVWAEVVKSGKKMCLQASAKILSQHERDGRLIDVHDLRDAHWGYCPDWKAFKRGAK